MTGCQICGGFGDRHDPIVHSRWADAVEPWAQLLDIYGPAEAQRILDEINAEIAAEDAQ